VFELIFTIFQRLIVQLYDKITVLKRCSVETGNKIMCSAPFLRGIQKHTDKEIP